MPGDTDELAWLQNGVYTSKGMFTRALAMSIIFTNKLERGRGLRGVVRRSYPWILTREFRAGIRIVFPAESVYARYLRISRENRPNRSRRRTPAIRTRRHVARIRTEKYIVQKRREETEKKKKNTKRKTTWKIHNARNNASRLWTDIHTRFAGSEIAFWSVLHSGTYTERTLSVSL